MALSLPCPKLHPPQRMRLGASRPALLVATLVAAICEVGRAASTEEARDWLRVVPGDVQFYVEVRDLSALRTRFQELGIWETVVDLSEAGGGAAASQPWQRRTRELLGLTREEIITELLGRRSALFSSTSAAWQDGVVMAELPDEAEVARLMRRWRPTAVREEGAVRRYRLGGGLNLAVHGTLMVLGPAGDPDGLWGRTVLLLEGRRGPSLGARSDFSSLRARLALEPAGLMYVAWPDGDPTAPAGCGRLLAAFARTPGGVTCEIHGQQCTAPGMPSVEPWLDFTTLPASTVLVYSGGRDFSDLARRAQEGAFEDSRGLLEFLLTVFVSIDAQAGPAFAGLGPGYVIVVDDESAARVSTLRLPSVAALVQAKDPAAMMGRLDTMMAFVGMFFASLATGGEVEPPPVDVRKERCDDVEVHWIDIGPFLAARTRVPAFQAIQVCWAGTERRVIVSTSVEHVRRLIRAARAGGRRLDDPLVQRPRPAAATDRSEADWLYVRGAGVAGLLSNALEYLERHHPDVLTGPWWEAWAQRRAREVSRLGLALTADREYPRRAVVREVEDRSPAAGVIQVGDVIVGVAGAPLATSRPAQEVAGRYHQRGSSTTFRMSVLRNGRTVDVDIAVPPAVEIIPRGFDPVEAVRRLMVLFGRIGGVTVQRYAARPERLEVRIDVRWERPSRSPAGLAAPGRR